MEKCMERNELQRTLHWGKLRSVVRALNGFTANAVTAMTTRLDTDRP